MATGSQDSLKGQFLLAMPSLADPNFSLTVTCLCEHTPAGALGIVINRVYPSLTARDILDELKIPAAVDAAAIPVHYGGPVHTDELFILHTPPFTWEGSLQVSPTLGMSNTRDLLTAIAAGEGPERYLLALGCAGWGPGQLEAEIRDNSWLTSPVFDGIIFDAPVETRWEATLRRMGIDPLLLTDTAGNA